MQAKAKTASAPASPKHWRSQSPQKCTFGKAFYGDAATTFSFAGRSKPMHELHAQVQIDRLSALKIARANRQLPGSVAPDGEDGEVDDYVRIGSPEFVGLSMHDASEKLTALVPEIYLSTGSEQTECPICMTAIYNPVRLFCGHLFCERCVSETKKHGSRACPLCRAADALALPREHMRGVGELSRRSHPAEYKLKQNEDSDEQKKYMEARLRQRYGGRDPCVVS
jgi:hypothetical protein